MPYRDRSDRYILTILALVASSTTGFFIGRSVEARVREQAISTSFHEIVPNECVQTDLPVCCIDHED